MALISETRRAYITRWGVGRSIYAALMQRLSRYLGLTFCVVVARPIKTGPISSSGDGREYRVLTEQELIEFSQDPELDLNPQEIRASLARGEICAGCIEDGQLLGYMWRAYSPSPHSEILFVDFGDNSLYAYKSLTRSAFRGQRIQSAVSAATENVLKKGRTHVIGYIRSDNYPSVRQSKFDGSKIIGYAGYWSLFGRTLCFRSLGAKKAGFRFFVRKVGK